MITYYILWTIAWIVSLAFGLLPIVTEVPFGMGQAVALAGGYVRAFTEIFWPVIALYYALMFYIAFRIGMLSLKLFLGSRVPDIR